MRKALFFLFVLLTPALGWADFVEVEDLRFEFQLPTKFVEQSDLTGSTSTALLDEIGAADRDDFLIYADPTADVNEPCLLLFGKRGRHVATGMGEDDFALFTLFLSLALVAEDENNPFGVPAVMDKAESLYDVVITLIDQRAFSFSVVIDEEVARYGAMVSYYHSGSCLFNVIQVALVDELAGYNEFIGRAAVNLQNLGISQIAPE